ncbi:MAG: SRPBCC domain-containing protein [Caldimonas sp.]
MNHYQQRLVLEAPVATVYAALTTPEGLRGWWTEDCDGDRHVGGTFHVRFGVNHKDMRIEGLQANREVRWLCTAAYMAQFARKDEWVGTRLIFRLSADAQGRTVLDFEHIGLVPAFECYDLCNDCWQYVLGSLRGLVETGRGTPVALAPAAVAA